MLIHGDDLCLAARWKGMERKFIKLPPVTIYRLMQLVAVNWTMKF